MLMGQFQHTFDPKGRVIFPAKLRDELGAEFVVTRGIDHCLFVYSLNEWAALEARIRELPIGKGRDLLRFFFANAEKVTPDGQGRILIPQNLRQYAGLTKDVTVIGVSTRAEIWDTTKWEEACASFSDESIAAAMDELGF